MTFTDLGWQERNCSYPHVNSHTIRCDNIKLSQNYCQKPTINVGFCILIKRVRG